MFSQASVILFTGMCASSQNASLVRGVGCLIRGGVWLEGVWSGCGCLVRGGGRMGQTPLPITGALTLYYANKKNRRNLQNKFHIALLINSKKAFNIAHLGVVVHNPVAHLLHHHSLPVHYRQEMGG